MCNVRPPEPLPPKAKNASPRICPGCNCDLDDPDTYLTTGIHDICQEVRVLHVKTKKVGYLVGHHGRTIKGFEASSGTKIDILVANSISQETPVRIAGNRKGVSAASQMVLDLFSFHNFTSKHWKGSPDLQAGAEKVFRWKGPPQDKILVANEEVIVSADDGMTLDNFLVSAVEEESGCKLIVHSTGDDLASPVSINVIGTKDIIPKAIQMINTHISDCRSAMPFNSRNRFQLNHQMPQAFTQFSDMENWSAGGTTPSGYGGVGTSGPADPWELLGDALAGTEPLSDEEDLFGGGGGITNSSTATPGLASSETIVISPDETESPRQHQTKTSKKDVWKGPQPKTTQQPSSTTRKGPSVTKGSFGGRTIVISQDETESHPKQTKPRKSPQQKGPPKPPAPPASSTSSALKALREQLKKKGPPVPTVRETVGGASNDGDSRDHHNNKVPPPPPSGKKPGVALEKQREIRRSLNKNSEKLVSESLRINSVKLACVSLKPFCIKHRVRMEIEQQAGQTDQNVIIHGPKKNVQVAKTQLLADIAKCSGNKKLGGSAICTKDKAHSRN